MPSATALEQLRRLGPVFRSKDAVSAGVSWRAWPQGFRSVAFVCPGWTTGDG